MIVKYIISYKCKIFSPNFVRKTMKILLSSVLNQSQNIFQKTFSYIHIPLSGLLVVFLSK